MCVKIAGKSTFLRQNCLLLILAQVRCSTGKRYTHKKEMQELLSFACFLSPHHLLSLSPSLSSLSLPPSLPPSFSPSLLSLPSSLPPSLSRWAAMFQLARQWWVLLTDYSLVSVPPTMLRNTCRLSTSRCPRLPTSSPRQPIARSLFWTR